MTSITKALLQTSARTRQSTASLGLAAALYLAQPWRSSAENQAGYRFESYKEDGGRINIETQAGLFDVKLAPWLNLKGEVVYDAISGATPTGAPPASQVQVIDVFTGEPMAGPFSDSVPLSKMHDIRWAGGIAPTISYGKSRFTPGFNYSEEHDYVSYGAAFNYSVDLNEKNTTLNTGWSHNWDTIYPDGRRLRVQGHKNSDDFLVGINQLLGPKTVLTLNLTYGNAHGYLADPYKGVKFDGDTVYSYEGNPDPVNPSTRREVRPRHRHRYIGYTSLTQFITPLNASIEGSYRFFHDSYGINSHTFGLAWYQKLGKRITISPQFRYSWQGAADFYVTRLPGLPTDEGTPTFYSADYRLSKMETFSYGIMADVKVTDWLSLEGGYKRYEMFGLDHMTSPTAYLKAHIVTIGFRAWF